MNQPEEELQSQTMDALLGSLYENSDSHAQSLVTKGFERLEREENEPRRNSKAYQSRGVPRWKLLSLAAGLLLMIAIGWQLLAPPKRAMAAVNLSIQQALEDIGRHYKLTLIIKRPDHSKTTRRSDLYAKGANKFAVRSSRDLGSKPIWMGSRNGKAWVVPALGPVITGNRTNLSTWVSRSEETSTPYLHVTTILERMRDSYTLSVLPDETINTADGDFNSNFDCAHIVATLANDEPRIPNRIELWSDTESGVAIKVLATWDLADNESGRQSLLVELNENIDLADAFFTPNEHGGQNRRRINFGSDD